MLFAYGTDADALYAAVEQVLSDSAAARGAVVTRRYGRADDAEAREETHTL
jgi:hypothetical protein